MRKQINNKKFCQVLKELNKMLKYRVRGGKCTSWARLSLRKGHGEEAKDRMSSLYTG
jgi:hypothetical protein